MHLHYVFHNMYVPYLYIKVDGLRKCLNGKTNHNTLIILHKHQLSFCRKFTDLRQHMRASKLSC